MCQSRVNRVYSTFHNYELWKENYGTTENVTHTTRTKPHNLSHGSLEQFYKTEKKGKKKGFGEMSRLNEGCQSSVIFATPIVYQPILKSYWREIELN